MKGDTKYKVNKNFFLNKKKNITSLQICSLFPCFVKRKCSGSLKKFQYLPKTTRVANWIFYMITSLIKGAVGQIEEIKLALRVGLTAAIMGATTKSK